MKKLNKILPLFLIFSFLVLPLKVAAQQGTALTFVCGLLKQTRDIIGAIGFAIAVIILIVGGISYMTAGGDAEKANSAKKLIINAIIGIAILIATMFILTLVTSIISGAGVKWSPFKDPCGTIKF